MWIMFCIIAGSFLTYVAVDLALQERKLLLTTKAGAWLEQQPRWKLYSFGMLFWWFSMLLDALIAMLTRVQNCVKTPAANVDADKARKIYDGHPATTPVTASTPVEDINLPPSLND